VARNGHHEVRVQVPHGAQLPSFIATIERRLPTMELLDKVYYVADAEGVTLITHRLYEHVDV
jgi:hypothetical protein